MHLQVKGDIGFRAFKLEAVCEIGDIHTHNYDHVTRCTKGEIDVIELDANGTPQAPIRLVAGTPNDHATVLAASRHQIKAVTVPCEYQCEFQHRDWNGTIIQKYNGNPKAYE